MSNDKPRPVSGEIMTDARTRTTFIRNGSDAVDAEFEQCPTPSQEPSRISTVLATEGLDFLRPGDTAALEGRTKTLLFWLIGICLVVFAFWSSGGHALVKAAAGKQVGLSLDGISSRIEKHSGRDVLFLEGQVENRGLAVRTLPILEIVVRSNYGVMTNYYLGTNQVALASGERYSFSSRMAASKTGVETVSAAFQEFQR